MCNKYTHIGNLRITARRVEEFIPDRGFVLNPRKTISRYLRQHGPVTKTEMLRYFQNVLDLDLNDIDRALAELKNDRIATSYRQSTRTKPTTVWDVVSGSDEWEIGVS